MEPADPDFYKIGFVRSMRAYGIEFKEGPDGFGVYASKDVEPLRRARVSCFLWLLDNLLHLLECVNITVECMMQPCSSVFMMDFIVLVVD